MSRYYTTQSNHETAVLSILSSLFYWMRSCHWTHEQYLDERNERLFASNHYKRLSDRRKAFVAGIEHERFWGQFYKEDLEYCHAVDDGRILSIVECNEESKTWPRFYSWLNEHRIEELSGTYYKDNRARF